MKSNTIYNLGFLICVSLLSQTGVYAQTIGKNWIITYQLRTPQTDEMVVPGLSKENVQKTVAYHDGLGRAREMVQVAASPLGYDQVTPVAYDEFGREVKKYLPYTTSTANQGAWIDNDSTSQRNFYTSLYNSADGARAFAARAPLQC